MTSLTEFWKKRSALCTLALFVLLALVYFSPAIVGGKTMVIRDLNSHYFGQRTFYKESILNGEIPYWNPYILCGSPNLANIQNATLYPLSAIFIIFPISPALNLFAAVHIALFGFFIYLLARECRLSWQAALLAGFVGFMAGNHLRFSEFPESVAGITWLPLVLYWALRLMRRNNWGSALGLSLAAAMQILAGGPYPPFYSLVSAAVFGVFYILLNRVGVKKTASVLCKVVVAGILALCFCAPQLLPTVEAANNLPAELKITVMPPDFSMRPADSLLLLFPKIFGYPDWQKCIYLGVLPVLLLVLGFVVWIVSKKTRPAVDAKSENQPEHFVVSLIAVAVTGVLLSAGGLWGFDKLLSHIPSLSRCYKWPSISFWITTIGFSVLCGFIFERVMSVRENAGVKKSMGVLLGVAAVIALLLLVFPDAVSGLLEKARVLWNQKNILIGLTSETISFKHYPIVSDIRYFALFLLLSSAAAGVVVFSRLRPALCLVVFLCALLPDKAVLMSSMHFYNDTNIYAIETANVKRLLAAGADKSMERIYYPEMVGGLNSIACGSTDATEFLLLKDLMIEATVLQYHIFQTHGFGAVRNMDYEYILRPWYERLPAPARDKVLGLLNVRFILDAGMDQTTGHFSYSLRENPLLKPRAWISYGAVGVQSWQQCVGLTMSDGFNPMGTALIHDSTDGIPVDLMKQSFFSKDVDSVKYTNNTITIKASSQQPGFLYISDVYDKNWRAYLDGAEVKVYKTNLAGKGVVFPAGEHTLKFVYYPKKFYLGLAMCAAAALVCAGVFAFGKYKRRDKTA